MLGVGLNETVNHCLAKYKIALLCINNRLLKDYNGELVTMTGAAAEKILMDNA